MSSYDYDDGPVREHRRYVREERREERVDPRYGRDSYLKPYPSRELVPRSREDSDFSVEEVRRDFPPPGYSSRDVRRARSADPRYDDYDEPRGHDRGYDDDRDYDRHRRKGGSSVYYEEERTRRRVMSRQEQIIAAVAGAALAVGGKELYDRRDAKEHHSDVKRNPLASAALAAAGGLAAYQGAEFYNKAAAKEEKKGTYILHRGRDGKVTEYYSDEEEDPKAKKGHKNFFESALGAAGLGGAVKALTGGGHDDKRDSRSRRGSSGSRSRSRSRSRGGKNEAIGKIQKAAMASLIAGATEAFRVRKEPGSWSGEKTKRILTAAAGAGAIDSAQHEEHGKLGILESVIGGLGANRLIRGSRNTIEEDRKTGRSRSRSRARSTGGGGGGASGLAALATAGLGALGAKKLADTVQRSRSQSRSRRRSVDSFDSRDGSPDRRRRSRSRSVVDSARKSLAKLGIGKDPEDKDRDRRRDRDDYDDRSSRRGGDRGSDDYDDDNYSRRGQGRGGRDDHDDDRSRGSKRRDSSRRRGDSSGDESSLGDSDEDEKRAKKMRDRRRHH